jgi:uncharacterized membrane protein
MLNKRVENATFLIVYVAKIVQIIKNSVLNSHNKFCFLSAKTSGSILLKERIVAFCEMYTVYNICRARGKLLEY